jgi:hypothetical protein
MKQQQQNEQGVTKMTRLVSNYYVAKYHTIKVSQEYRCAPPTAKIG